MCTCSSQEWALRIIIKLYGLNQPSLVSYMKINIWKSCWYIPNHIAIILHDIMTLSHTTSHSTQNLKDRLTPNYQIVNVIYIFPCKLMVIMSIHPRCTPWGGGHFHILENYVTTNIRSTLKLLPTNYRFSFCCDFSHILGLVVNA